MTQQAESLQRTITKVGKADCEGTFARASGNDEVAPIAVTRWAGVEPLSSTRSCRSPPVQSPYRPPRQSDRHPAPCTLSPMLPVTRTFCPGTRSRRFAYTRSRPYLRARQPACNLKAKLDIAGRGAPVSCSSSAFASPGSGVSEPWTCFGKVESSRMSAEELDDAPATVYERI